MLMNYTHFIKLKLLTRNKKQKIIPKNVILINKLRNVGLNSIRINKNQKIKLNKK